MKKIVKKLLIVFVVLSILPVSLMYLSVRATIYKFGILVDDYKDVISELPNYFAVNKNVNKYSWHTPMKLPDSDIEITLEHLVVASDFDIKLIPEITDKKKLMTIIHSSSNRIVSIKIDNEVDGYKLKKICSYLYFSPTDQEKELYPLGWKIVKQENEKIEVKEKEFAYSEVYDFPDKMAFSLLGFKGMMFRSCKQLVTIQYLDADDTVQEKSYEFDLAWYKYLTGFDKMMMI